MIGIKESLKKIYSNENNLTKHTILFVLSGIAAMFATPLNELSNQPIIPPSSYLFILGALFILLVISVYLNGYLYKFINNSFSEKKENLLPEFDMSHFKTFFKALPLLLTWLAYIIATVLLVILFSIGLTFIMGPVLTKTLVVLLVTTLTIIFSIMFQFILTGFAKNFERKGLYNIKLPFVYLTKTFKEICSLYFRALPLLILVIILNMLSNGSSVISYIFTAIGMYINTVVGYVLAIGYVEIYKEKINI